ncbi:hypothetical protein TSUD_238870 [Trifolium subterraneum]|uniref:Reverse transcriptase zinc-binding domain-containing protein n=1 Tax=Trifolium subterraneum TaxID=3900 RepID=A0A2Z6P5K6_TRISU|nr:hypothetical protein TSUD_238870 [Trifolium subterraneum]
MDRLATRVNLARRRLEFQEQGQNCVLCNSALESADHLFLRCEFSSAVWYQILGWLGCLVALPSKISSLCHLMAFLGSNKKINSGLLLIWHATIWVLWNKRNAKMFSDKVCLYVEVWQRSNNWHGNGWCDWKSGPLLLEIKRDSSSWGLTTRYLLTKFLLYGEPNRSSSYRSSSYLVNWLLVSSSSSSLFFVSIWILLLRFIVVST